MEEMLKKRIKNNLIGRYQYFFVIIYFYVDIMDIEIKCYGGIDGICVCVNSVDFIDLIEVELVIVVIDVKLLVLKINIEFLIR